jgi:putative dimethyl sulfoxide reductase chaperone
MKNGVEIHETIRPLVEVRKYLYDILRWSFLKEPTLNDALFVKEMVSLTEVPFKEESLLISNGVSQIKNFFSQNDINDGEVYSALHWDYTRLFIGPYELPAPPWESAYLNKERLLFQEETLKVRQFYLKYSFLPVEFGHEADDHLGLELDFMFRLNELALEAMGRENHEEVLQLLNDQKLFLEEHLLKWVPQLADKVVENANTDFYRGMAKVLKGFLLLDLRALNELLEI